MRRLKPVHYLFMLLNLLGCIFEYFLVYKLIFRNLLKLEHSVSAVLTIVVFILLFVVTIYTVVNNQKVFEKDNNTKVSKFKLEVIDKIKERYKHNNGKDINIQFVDGDLQPSIMFALLENVYINTNKRYSYRSIDDIHFEGILSHEVGHTLHMRKIYALANLRLTAIIGNLLFIDTINYSHRISKKDASILNYIIFGLKYFFFILFNLINLLILYPFKRFEELQADTFSLTVSNGYSLRGYYYKIHKNHNSKIERFRFKFIDFNHPEPLTHYNRLNKLMVNSNKNCELYQTNNIYVNNYFDESDKYKQIISFIEEDVDTKLPSLYLYLGKLAENHSDVSKAMKYYKLAGENKQLVGYRKLIRLLRLENKNEESMTYYKILAKSGDIEAKIYNQYYYKDFYLTELVMNGETKLIDSNEVISLTLLNDLIYKKEDETETIKFNRSKNIIYLSNSKIYLLEKDMIVSKPYSLYDEKTDEVIEVVEYFKKQNTE